MSLLEATTAPGGISARMVKDSICNGKRIISIETKSPVFIDAEIEKHRIISTNTTSTRAVPTHKVLSGYLPHDVRLNQKGMQGYTPISSPELQAFHADLQELLDHTNEVLQQWQHLHKQHVNRYLSPFLYQHKIWTATEWDNFFILRLPFEELTDKQQYRAERWESKFGAVPDGKAAQPEMQALARCMKAQIDQSTPKRLGVADWHLPYIDFLLFIEQFKQQGIKGITIEEAMRKCSVARCARVSLSNHGASCADIAEDITLYHRLLSNYHMSPFEHQATPAAYTTCSDGESDYPWMPGVTHADKDGYFWSANFKGWIQYRKFIERE